MQPEPTPNSPDELMERFSNRQSELQQASGYTQRQKQLVDSLLDSDDDELFNERFHKRLLIELVGFMHDWHMRSPARRFQEGDVSSALLCLQDATRLSLIQDQIEAIEVTGSNATDGASEGGTEPAEPTRLSGLGCRGACRSDQSPLLPALHPNRNESSGCDFRNPWRRF